MSIVSDVRSTRLAASGDVFATRARIKGVYLVPGVGAGSVAIRNGGSGGDVLCTMDTTAGGSAVYLQLPGAGLLCPTSAYATLTGVAAATFFYA
jgi:hypothetical protein